MRAFTLIGQDPPPPERPAPGRPGGVRVFGDLLRDRARRAPAASALIEGGRRLSYAEFDAASDRLAASLVASGLAPGARLGAMMTNRSEYALLAFAAARAGLVLAHFSTRSTGRDLAYMIGKVGIAMLCVQHDLLPVVAAAREAGAAWPRIVPVGGAEDGFAALAAGETAKLPEIDPEALLALNFTGGTTGLPKAVAATHRARLASIAAAEAGFGLRPRDRCILATPMFHTVGLHVWFGATIAAGAAALPLAGWDVERFLALVEHQAATAVLLVPTQISDVLRAPLFAPERLAGLRQIHFAGAPMPAALLDRLEAELPGIAAIEHYGQSETGPLALRPPTADRARRGSVGRAMRGVELAIVDAHGNRQPPGTIGEVLARGDCLLRDYWGDRAETEAAFRFGDGWLATGDLGFLDMAGFLTLVDRAKDMIVSGGENLYPVEIENALHRHPAVAECAVFGVPDDHWGEVPIAHVVLRAGMQATAQELIALVEHETARWKRPRVVEFVAALPRTAVGKIQKNLLRAPYWAARARRI